MTGYYETNPADPDAPVLLSEYKGIKPGDSVAYGNPGTPPIPGPLTVAAIYQFTDNGHGGWVAAVLNDGVYEVNADHLRITGGLTK